MIIFEEGFILDQCVFFILKCKMRLKYFTLCGQSIEITYVSIQFANQTNEMMPNENYIIFYSSLKNVKQLPTLMLAIINDGMYQSYFTLCTSGPA